MRGLRRILSEVDDLHDMSSVADHVANMAGGPMSNAAEFVRDALEPLITTAVQARDGRQGKIQDAQLHIVHVLNMMKASETLASEAYALLGPLATSRLGTEMREPAT